MHPGLSSVRATHEIHEMISADLLTAILERVEDDENELRDEVEGILEHLINHSKAGGFTLRWARQRMVARYASEVVQLIQRANGFHFTAKKTTAERLREFDIDELASNMSILAPDLWSLFSSLLAADTKVNYKREWTRRSGKAPNHTLQRTDSDVEMLDVCDFDEDGELYWKDADEHPLVDDEDDEPEDAEDQRKQRAERVTMTVSIIR
jgi:hypothetical protein